MGDAERSHRGLFPQIRETFLEIGIDREGESGFGDFRHFGGFQCFRSCFGSG